MTEFGKGRLQGTKRLKGEVFKTAVWVDRGGAEYDAAQHNTHVLDKYTEHILTRVFRLYLRLCLTTTLSMEDMFDQVRRFHSCGAFLCLE